MTNSAKVIYMYNYRRKTQLKSLRYELDRMNNYEKYIRDREKTINEAMRGMQETGKKPSTSRAGNAKSNLVLLD